MEVFSCFVVDKILFSLVRLSQCLDTRVDLERDTITAAGVEINPGGGWSLRVDFVDVVDLGGLLVRPLRSTSSTSSTKYTPAPGTTAASSDADGKNRPVRNNGRAWLLPGSDRL